MLVSKPPAKCLKTLWENKQMLVSNFSASPTMFSIQSQKSQVTLNCYLKIDSICRKCCSRPFSPFPTISFSKLLNLGTVWQRVGGCKILSSDRDCGESIHVALTHFHTMTPFDALGNKPFENTMGKGETARTEQFLLFPQCFLSG